MSAATNSSINNQLLATLPKKEYEALYPYLEEVPLIFDKVLHQPNGLIRDVYFPNSGIISLLAGADEDDRAFAGAQEAADLRLIIDDQNLHLRIEGGVWLPPLVIVLFGIHDSKN
mgnify:CR=1 FL=1